MKLKNYIIETTQDYYLQLTKDHFIHLWLLKADWLLEVGKHREALDLLIDLKVEIRKNSLQ